MKSEKILRINPKNNQVIKLSDKNFLQKVKKR